MLLQGDALKQLGTMADESAYQIILVSANLHFPGVHKHLCDIRGIVVNKLALAKIKG